ncbi:MAG: heme exporter protein CcmB [Nitrospinae bacterium]|nr:heme exporter protein CcmB [Nitrospinota bacterium]
MSFLDGVLLVMRKDLAMELRAKEIFTTTAMFSLLVVVIFNFAFDMTGIDVKAVAAGVLWVAFIFSGAVAMNRGFMREQEEGCLSALLLAPIDRSAIYFGKMLSGLLVMLATMALVTPIFMVLYNVNVMEHYLWQTLTFFLGAVGFMAVGTLISAMSVNLRAREMMGPLLLLPVVAPVIIAAVKMSGGLVRGEDLASLMVWIKILASFDVIYLVVAWLVFEHIVEE